MDKMTDLPTPVEAPRNAGHVYCSTCRRFVPVPEDESRKRLRDAYNALVKAHANCPQPQADLLRAALK